MNFETIVRQKHEQKTKEKNLVGVFNLAHRFAKVEVFFNPYSGKQGMVLAKRHAGDWIAEPIDIAAFRENVDKRSYRPDRDYNDGAIAMAQSLEKAFNLLLMKAYPIETLEEEDASTPKES